MTTLIVIAVIILIVLAVAFYVIRQKNRESNIARADQLRNQAATRAQTTLPPAQDRAAEAEAKAEEARAVAERARAEAEEARLVAQHAEAEHEAQVRAADRLDPRVDHKADDYDPQVGGTVDQQPTPPSEVNAAPEEAPAQPAHATEPTAGPEPTADSTPDSTPDPTETSTPDSTETSTPTSTQPSTQSPGAPLLPRRNPGSHEMPGKPMESDDGQSGGWFTRKDSDRS